jgi:uncharacterized membrane protein YagU involved in acid resistance
MKSINSGEYRPWVESFMKWLGVPPAQNPTALGASEQTAARAKTTDLSWLVMAVFSAVFAMVLTCLAIGLFQFVLWNFDLGGLEVRLVVAAGIIGAILGVIGELYARS